MKKNVVILSALLLSAFNLPPSINRIDNMGKPFSAEGKKVIVFTTADSSNLKLTLTDTLSFKNLSQPKETQVCVFVDPSKTFQSFLGIGGALTDASAETFAKLPKAKQQEFMQAYYNVNKGIGYTLARTTIHSSDFSSDSYTYISEGDKYLKSFNVYADLIFICSTI